MLFRGNVIYPTGNEAPFSYLSEIELDCIVIEKKSGFGKL